MKAEFIYYRKPKSQTKRVFTECIFLLEKGGEYRGGRLLTVRAYNDKHSINNLSSILGEKVEIEIIEHQSGGEIDFLELESLTILENLKQIA